MQSRNKPVSLASEERNSCIPACLLGQEGISFSEHLLDPEGLVWLPDCRRLESYEMPYCAELEDTTAATGRSECPGADGTSSSPWGISGSGSQIQFDSPVPLQAV